MLGEPFPCCCSEGGFKVSKLPRDICDVDVFEALRGGLDSWVGELGLDWTGVVYSDELPETGGSLLKSLMVDCMTLKASKVEENGSPSSSSPALVIWSRMEGRGSNLRMASWEVEGEGGGRGGRRRKCGVGGRG